MLWWVGTMPDNAPNNFHLPTGNEQLAGNDKIGSRGQESEISTIRLRLHELKGEQSRLEATLANLERELSTLETVRPPPDPSQASVTNSSPASAKIALFRRLFQGRPDVYPLRWENMKSSRAGYSPACANEWVRGTCAKPKVKCGECPHQAFIPVSDDVIDRHLRGGGAGSSDFVAGVYPLHPDGTCWFLAADFDKAEWAQDATALLETCRARGIAAALERSRSGNGGHVWMFFDAPVPAAIARQMGAALLTETMERRPEIGFASYDRFFPNQDTMPIGGFGNLIALPLQWRARQAGNSVFVDDSLTPFKDQWAYLSTLPRNPAETIITIASEAALSGRILGVRMPVDDEFADEPWKMSPSRRVRKAPIEAPLPTAIEVVIADQIYFERNVLPPALVAQVIRLAAFQNPEFYRAQAMRFATFGKPRIISCAELHARHIALPRGCLDELTGLLQSYGIEVRLRDHREFGQPLADRVSFRGELLAPQHKAFSDLIIHDHGVLAATTAFGKTVVAAAMIAKRQCNTLVLVHRRELLDQWVARLRSFLDIDPNEIGT